MTDRLLTKQQQASGLCSAHQYPHPGERDHTPDCHVCYPTSNEETLVRHVCTAYESGFGHGIDSRDLMNPYVPLSSAWEAYRYGYEQGTKRRSPVETSDPQSCQEPDGCPTEVAVLKRFWRQHHTSSECKHDWKNVTNVETIKYGKRLKVCMKCDAERVGSVEETTERQLTDVENDTMDRDMMTAIKRDEKAPEDPRMEEVRTLMRKHRQGGGVHHFGALAPRAAAVKLYREIHGCGLRSAIDACDALL